MNEVEWLKSLDGPRPAPLVDVVPGVMRAIRAVEPDPVRIYQYAAAAALLAGVVSLIVGLPALTSGPDPLSGVAEAFNLVLR